VTDVRPVDALPEELPEELPDTSVVETVEQAIHRGPSSATHLPRWLAPAAICAVIGMVPWIVYLALTLPGRSRTAHYNVAWVGFDCAMVLVLAALAIAAFRRHPATGPVAAVAATMFVIDAWFDVTTSRGSEFLIALILAVFAEIPLALVCAWTAVNAERVRERAYRNLHARWRLAERALSRRSARATKTPV
jgi:hypothetical protein